MSALPQEINKLVEHAPAGLKRAEIRATVRSGLDAGPRKARQRAVQAQDGQEEVKEMLGGGNGEAEEERTSWAPVDLAERIRQGLKRAAPSLMPRQDGICLLYPGLVHSVHGESESGKSWLVQVETARLLRAGERVLYLDMESDPDSILDRLLNDLGVPQEAVLAGLEYRHPEEHPTAGAWAAILGGRYALVVIDGVTDALGAWMRGGGGTNDNDDVSRWLRKFPKALATATGAAVVLIDHVTKSREGRGRFAIGGQAKLSGLTGAAYTVDLEEPFGRGMRGRASVWVGKDRPGSVRQHAGKADGRLQPIADFVLDSNAVGRVTAELLAPCERPSNEGKQQARSLAVSLLLRGKGELRAAQIYDEIGGKKQDVYALLDEMRRDGLLVETRLRKDGDRQSYPYLSLAAG